MTQNLLHNLEPKLIWQIFEEITRIYRPSKGEEKIGQWIKNWAYKNHINCKEDKVGNLLLVKEASEGCKDWPTLILQGHQDMVYQKLSECEINFETDPLRLKIEENYLTAEGTTLGADNGIGIAYGLAALIDPEITKHGKIEVLFTVDEETGLTGVFQMEKGFFSGKRLLNLDGEDFTQITISSAGGQDTHIKLKIEYTTKKDLKGVKIIVGGLQGGHSGVDIHLPRKNAIKVIINILKDISKEFEIFIQSINGGTAHNAIPRDAEAVIYYKEDNYEAISNFLNGLIDNTITENQKNESLMKIKVEEYELDKIISSETSNTIISLLHNLPHGPISFSKQVEGLVQTSNNLATVKTLKDHIEIVLSSRSSIDAELESNRDKINSICKQYGAESSQKSAYPGWEPDLESPLLKLVHREYENILGGKVELKAIHAGLECGLFKKQDPNMQIVSFGPEIKFPHSPQERVFLEDVLIIWEVIKKVLANIDQT